MQSLFTLSHLPFTPLVEWMSLLSAETSPVETKRWFSFHLNPPSLIGKLNPVPPPNLFTQSINWSQPTISGLNWDQNLEIIAVLKFVFLWINNMFTVLLTVTFSNYTAVHRNRFFFSASVARWFQSQLQNRTFFDTDFSEHFFPFCMLAL